MNKKAILEKVYDQVMSERIATVKAIFTDKKTQFNNSDETEQSLSQKAQLIAAYMTAGMDFNIACDQSDVSIGSEDNDFVYSRYILKIHSLSYEEWYAKKCRSMIYNDIQIITE